MSLPNAYDSTEKQQQIEQWKKKIQKSHYGETIQCFSCPALDWGLYEITHRPCVNGIRFLSNGFCRFIAGQKAKQNKELDKPILTENQK